MATLRRRQNRSLGGRETIVLCQQQFCEKGNSRVTDLSCDGSVVATVTVSRVRMVATGFRWAKMAVRS
jgi:hypothetical protein